jgi:hypothetical protein
MVKLTNSAVLNSVKLAFAEALRPYFLALNDDFGRAANPHAERVVRRFLERAFPEPSSFER